MCHISHLYFLLNSAYAHISLPLDKYIMCKDIDTVLISSTSPASLMIFKHMFAALFELIHVKTAFA